MTDSNLTFWTIEAPGSYKISVQKARRFTDKEKLSYTKEFRELGLVGMGDSMELPFLSWKDMPKRQPDGEFCGCANQAWIITEEEKDHYIAMNTQRAQAAKEKERKEQIEYLSERIAKMRAQGELPSRLEARRQAKEYNDTYNEGGEGYVPSFFCQEDLQAAVKELEALLSGDVTL